MYRFVTCTDCAKTIATEELGTRILGYENGLYAIVCFDCYQARINAYKD